MKCLQCNNKITGRKKKFCSQNCGLKHRRAVSDNKPKNCTVCGCKFKPTTPQKLMCSETCKVKRNRELQRARTRQADKTPGFVACTGLTRALSCSTCTKKRHLCICANGYTVSEKTQKMGVVRKMFEVRNV